MEFIGFYWNMAKAKMKVFQSVLEISSQSYFQFNRVSKYIQIFGLYSKIAINLNKIMLHEYVTK